MKLVTSESLILIRTTISVRDALKRMDEVAEGILFVVDDDMRLLGTLTDGDIRRGILKGVEISGSIESIFNANPFFITRAAYEETTVKNAFEKSKFVAIPITHDNGIIYGYIRFDDLYKDGELPLRVETIDVPVVIMAGGKGTRLAPFTTVLPKPLVPVGERTILEHIIAEFQKYGVSEFFFTLNYKGEMIRAYFDGIEKNYKITYIREGDFWGTAGSLALLPETMPETFFVSNCDILVKANYHDVLAFHKKISADITVVSSIQHHVVPYGVLNFEKGGIVSSIEEKPEYTFCINTGVYVVEKACLRHIKQNQVFHMTHLMEAVMKNGGTVATYPVSENSYIDIGQWDEYRKAVEQISFDF